MIQLLSRFASLSMIGTVLLSLLPAGSMKRTAAFTLGLFTLLCWAEGIAALLHIEFEIPQPASVLSTTSVSIDAAEAEAAIRVFEQQEVLP